MFKDTPMRRQPLSPEHPDHHAPGMRRIQLNGSTEVKYPEGVKVSEDPLRVTHPIVTEIAATSFQWTLSPKDLDKALRQYFHTHIKGLPGNYLPDIRPEVDHEGNLLRLNITLICPETK